MKEVNNNQRLSYEYEMNNNHLSNDECNNTGKFRVDSYKKYIEEVSAFPVLSSKEKLELFKKSVLGDSQAKSDLINSYLNKVIEVASKFETEIPVLDLIQEGNVGVVEAIETFSCDKDCRLSTYVSRQINSRIVEYIQDMDGSLNLSFSEEREEILRELVSDIDNLENQTIKNMCVEEVMNVIEKRLNSKQKDIIKRYLGLYDGVEQSYEEIAEAYDFSKSWIGAIKRKAIRKVKYDRHIEDLEY